MMAQMLPEVEEAVAEIRAASFGKEVQVAPSGDGGAEVTVEGVDLGERYEPRESFVGFRIHGTYPFSQVYPHFLRADLRKANGTPLPNPGMVSGQQWRGRPAIMVSRSSRNWDPNRDTAVGKLYKVLEWVRYHA
jgi:hypothetical protein